MFKGVLPLYISPPGRLDEREKLLDVVKEELRSFYYTFFNAPENLIVVFKDEIIQGK
ncbi:hypothetical protein [Pelotomaculum schinkii]|uniref:hypothetical protein n=1 Tax=Pelotomaculum schinkii TaxID=78350 RepID=UPI00167EB4D7|nr:hypothetical protein [Pelotomaculum schinkii]